MEAATNALDEVLRQLEEQKAIVARATEDEKQAKAAEAQAIVDKEAAAAVGHLILYLELYIYSYLLVFL